ncbi:MAG: hypothetical protein ISS45_05975 [Candidatus Omnitrophica bacterium]|nr:hypothetical protein [Candidatus Omnitrophota bacterium]
MRKRVIFLIATLILVTIFVNAGFCEDDKYYARCNLKVIKGDHITWINWQASPSFILVGTELKVAKKGRHLVNVKTGASYTLDAGAKGDMYLEKFITKTPIDIKHFPDNVQSNIKKALAKVGMTKKEVYIAMGPPAKIPAGSTKMMTYDEIMRADLWIYARRRFGKNIGVAFDPVTGKVNRTEGIWRK